MMDNVSECIRKVKHSLSSSKELNLIGTLLTPPTTDPDSPASSDAQNSDFIDILNEQTSTTVSSSSSSTKEEDCASTSSISVSKNSSIICKWMNCDWPGHSDDLVDHIREIHVDLQPYHYHDQVNSTTNYVCFWQGCKVYGKQSSCKSWLENHVLQHSGPRPFRCIFENCNQRFKTRNLLEKHVNNHFANCDCTNPIDCTHQDTNHTNSHNHHSSNHKLTNGDGQQFNHLTGQMIKKSFTNGLSVSSPTSTPSKMLMKKKKKLKRRLVNVKTNNDLFDDCTMHHLKCSLIQLNSITGLDLIGDQRLLTFHAKVNWISLLFFIVLF